MTERPPSERPPQDSVPPSSEQAPPVPISDWGEHEDEQSDLQPDEMTPEAHSFIQRRAKEDPLVSPQDFAAKMAREMSAETKRAPVEDQAPAVPQEVWDDRVPPTIRRELSDHTLTDRKSAAELEEFYRKNPDLRPKKNEDAP